MKDRLFFFSVLLLAFCIQTCGTVDAPKGGYLDVGKIRLYYEEMGEGLPLIMLHGGLLDRRMWDDQFQLFSKQYRVIRYDVRNHGMSRAVPDTFTHYDDLYRVMEQLGIEKAVIMGLSLGGRIAVDFALEYPEKVSALVLAAPGLSGYNFNSPELQEVNVPMQKAFQEGNLDMGIEYFQRGWTDGPHREPSEVDSTIRAKVRTMAVNSAEHWNPQSRVVEQVPPAVDRLGEIQAPTLAVVGELDMPDILDIVDRIEKSVSGAKKVIVPGVAHMVNMEKPEEFNAIVLNFLGELSLYE